MSSQLTFLFLIKQPTTLQIIPKRTRSYRYFQDHQDPSPTNLQVYQHPSPRTPQVHHHPKLTNTSPNQRLKPNMNSFTILSTILSLSTLSYTLPTSQPRDGPCNALIETSPWHVSNFIVLNALPTAPTGSSIHFHVHDTNPGLEFETVCGLAMPQGTGTRPEEATGWHPCDDDRVRFLYQAGHDDVQGNLQLRRSYVDDWYVIQTWLEGVLT
jgi:hypothetical protein